MMIGDKIRELRLQLGLSQRQLAAPEMTRAYISMIENGRVIPSEKSLRIIAMKLGKPLSYFYAHDAQGDKEIYAALLTGANQKVKDKEPDVALHLLRKILSDCNDDRLKLEAYHLSISVKRSLRQLESAFADCQLALQLAQKVQDREKSVLLYLQMGAIAFAMEDFLTARESYQNVITLTHSLKSMEEERVKGLTFLATSSLRLGQPKAAIDAYEAALKEPFVQGNPEQYGMIAMGLGKALFEDGQMDKSYQRTKEAAARFKSVHSDNYAQALHNLAVLEMSTGHLLTSYELYEQCMKEYQRLNRVDKQASLMEDLATYWIKRGELDKAQKLCWEGIQLLEQKDDGLIRGRFYRALGHIYQEQRNYTQSFYSYRMSYDLLHRIKAHQEAEVSLQALNQLKQMQEFGTDEQGC